MTSRRKSGRWLKLLRIPGISGRPGLRSNQLRYNSASSPVASCSLTQLIRGVDMQKISDLGFSKTRSFNRDSQEIAENHKRQEPHCTLLKWTLAEQRYSTESSAMSGEERVSLLRYALLFGHSC